MVRFNSEQVITLSWPRKSPHFYATSMVWFNSEQVITLSWPRKSPHFTELEGSLKTPTGPSPWPAESSLNSVSWRLSNNILPSVSMSPKWSLFFQISYQNFWRTSHFCMYGNCPSRHVHLDFITQWNSSLSDPFQYFVASPLSTFGY
jgi:hypothetical protein